MMDGDDSSTCFVRHACQRCRHKTSIEDLLKYSLLGTSVTSLKSSMSLVRITGKITKTVFFFSTGLEFITHRKQQYHHLFTVVYKNSYLWSGFSLFLLEVKGQTRPLMHSLAWLLSPAKEEKIHQTWFSVYFESMAAKHNPRFDHLNKGH